MKTIHFLISLVFLFSVFCLICILRFIIFNYLKNSREFEWVISEPEENQEFQSHYVQNKLLMQKYESEFPNGFFEKKDITEPIVLWWTPFTLDTGSYKTCKNSKKCFFTNIRKYRKNFQTKALLFYGTDFNLHDLPLPREEHEEWGLLHEESPKNNYLFSFETIMKLFNHTATFKRDSDLPLISQYLSSIDELESRKYLKPTEVKNKLQKTLGLAPIAYIQSDCFTPSNRDLYVEAFMKHMKVDSYGSCLHNKDLPDGLKDPLSSMQSPEFYEFLSNYKFVFSMENAICNDYVTEKLWRSLYIGTVPVVFGSEKIDDILPTPKSAVNIRNFPDADSLASYLRKLNENDTEYESYLTFKKQHGVTNKYLVNLLDQREWGINNDQIKGNFIDKFECLVCERIHENIERSKTNKSPIKHQATVNHYGCPKPFTFNGSGSIIDDKDSTNWQFTYDYAFSMQKIFFEKYLKNGIYNFTAKQIQTEALAYHRNVFMNQENNINDLK